MAKKKLSKNAKIAIGVACTLGVLLIGAVAGGAAYLHEYCKTKEYSCISIADIDTKGKSVSLIAHRGFSAAAPENTLPAYELAGQNSFWGAECDIYRTKDGVWVLMHDSSTYRMMDKTAFVEDKTYDELMQFTYDNGVNIKNYPNLKICTLDEYLAVCRRYSTVPVIELKGKNNSEHYDEVVASVEKYAFSGDAVYISFHYKNLQEIRKLCDSTVLYLVQEIDDQSIADALALGGKCGIDFNGNKEENTKEMIEKCVSSGMIVGAWTIDTKQSAQKMIDCGVTMITTNCIVPVYSENIKMNLEAENQ